MNGLSIRSDNVEVAIQYFRLLDAGDARLFDLFAEDAEFYFPKYGRGVGKAALGEIAAQLGEVQASVEHDVGSYLFISSGERVVVEGTTKGVLKSGQRWAAGETPAGRFCNVFEIRDGLIKRLHVYLDPDYAGAHEEGFLWGREGRRW
ncbi:MAG TPA: nuclear transport factor 2 family protein [Caulobacteraceae bacterium]|jgi:ketosteroid isomerase-like protein